MGTAFGSSVRAAGVSAEGVSRSRRSAVRHSRAARRRGRGGPHPPSVCTPLPFGPHGCFRGEHLRGVAPNGKVGFRIAGSSPGPTERSGSARTGLSPVRSHALPSLLARSPGGGASYGGDPVLAWL